jgi:hypothetical protein
MINVDKDWKKFAAQAHSDKDVEKAFLDQAYVFIQNKATPFMKDPYKLGFEIVFKNDSNTRMVGIFAFRVNDELLYAPVFFINGSIKGTDLLYRHQTKKFVPLTNDWCQYMISLSPYHEGKGIKDDKKANSKDGLSLRKLIFPPNYSGGGSKYASYNEVAELNESLPKADVVYDELCIKAAEKIGDEKDVVKNFILEDGGYSSVDLLKEACLANEEFAVGMLHVVGPDNFMPSELNKEAAERKPLKDVGLHVIKKGFSDYEIEDNREETTSSVFLHKEAGFETIDGGSILSKVIKDDGAEKSTSIGGRYINYCHSAHELLKNAGTSSEFFITSINDAGDTVVVDTDNLNWQRTNINDLVPVKKEAGLESIQKNKEGYHAENFKEASANEELLVPGNFYMEMGVGGNDLSMSEPFQVVTPKETFSEGVEKYEVKDASSKQSRILLVKSASEITFIPCGEEKDLGLVSKRDFEKLTLGGGLKKASIHPRNGFYLIKEERGTTSELTKFGSQLYLMAELGLSKEASEDLFQQDKVNSKIEFYYAPTQEKSAANLSFDNPPDFYTGFDSEFDIPSESPERMTVMSRSTDINEPKSRTGDSMKFDSVKSLDSQTPESLMQLSEGVGNSSIFEHGVVGSLAKTYDSTMLIDKYMPDLENGLDKIGRLIFLFYWKPEDFSQLYGSDDQADLENTLLSNFKSFGDLVLTLLKKTKFNAPGIAVTTQ